MTDRITFAATVAAEGRRLKGSVTLAGSRTWRNGEWLEVDPAAVVKADATGAVATWEHDDSKILAADANGTLQLRRTDQGIEYETADLPNTSYANDALELVAGGYVQGTSFEIQGLRSQFTTDPDGTRVRRITSIKRLVAVNPVRDPAFTNSSVAAFSKESEVTEIIEEPVAAPQPRIETIPATPKADDKSDFYHRAEAFARDKSLTDLESFMDNLVSEGLDSDPKRDQYDAFASVYDERKKADARAKARLEQIDLAHKMRLGLVAKGPKADTGLFESDDYKAAFGTYMRTGDRAVMEQFAQAIAGDGTQGGFAVPESFLAKITERRKAFGGVQKYAENITTADGRVLPWPSNDDTANSAAIATEGSAVGSGGADFVLGEISLGAFSYDATGTSNTPLALSKELLQDSAFDFESFAARKLGERLGRKMAADFATGDGSGKPKGLFNKSADVMTATTMYLALVEHLFQVDQAYRENGNCRWLMSDTIFAKVLNSVDENNRPLFIPSADASAAGGATGFILGYPLSLDQGAGSLVAFGDINAGYIVRNVRGVTVDVDPYTLISKRQIAYHAWARADGQIQDSFAVSVSSYSGVAADAKA